jgi:hypothetical protein
MIVTAIVYLYVKKMLLRRSMLFKSYIWLSTINNKLAANKSIIR